MAANYHRIKPVDPVWYRLNATIRVRCPCGRDATERLGDFANARSLPLATALYEIQLRLRCRLCGARPDVTFTR